MENIEDSAIRLEEVYWKGGHRALARHVRRLELEGQVEALKKYRDLKTDDYEAPYQSAIINITILATKDIADLTRQLEENE